MTNEIVRSYDQFVGESWSTGQGREQLWSMIESHDQSGYGQDCS